jgi:hypothetical protein
MAWAAGPLPCLSCAPLPRKDCCCTPHPTLTAEDNHSLRAHLGTSSFNCCGCSRSLRTPECPVQRRAGLALVRGSRLPPCRLHAISIVTLAFAARTQLLRWAVLAPTRRASRTCSGCIAHPLHHILPHFVCSLFVTRTKHLQRRQGWGGRLACRVRPGGVGVVPRGVPGASPAQ